MGPNLVQIWLPIQGKGSEMIPTFVTTKPYVMPRSRLGTALDMSELRAGSNIDTANPKSAQERANPQKPVARPKTTLDRIVREGDGVKIHVVYVDFLVRPVGGELRPNSDVGTARWFSRDEIEANWDEIHIDTRRLFERIGFGRVSCSSPS